MLDKAGLGPFLIGLCPGGVDDALRFAGERGEQVGGGPTPWTAPRRLLPPTAVPRNGGWIVVAACFV